MLNPILLSVLDICRAGYEKRDLVSLPYFSHDLLSLGDFLLNGSDLGKTFRLRAQLEENRTVICFGGGIDSYIALYKSLSAGRPVTLVHVDYGQPYAIAEKTVFQNIRYAYQHRDDTLPTSGIHSDFQTLSGGKGLNLQLEFASYTIPLISKNESHLDFSWENYIVPARNLLLAIYGAAHGSDIQIVANKRSDETVGTPDKTSRFYRQTSNILASFYGRPYRVSSPFLHLSKLEAVQEYLHDGGSTAALQETWSCYNYVESLPQMTPCGTCYSCYKRYQLFQALNVAIDFTTPPWDGPNWKAYQEKEAKKGR